MNENVVSNFLCQARRSNILGFDDGCRDDVYSTAPLLVPPLSSVRPKKTDFSSVAVSQEASFLSSSCSRDLSLAFPCHPRLDSNVVTIPQIPLPSNLSTEAVKQSSTYPPCHDNKNNNKLLIIIIIWLLLLIIIIIIM